MSSKMRIMTPEEASIYFAEQGQKLRAERDALRAQMTTLLELRNYWIGETIKARAQARKQAKALILASEALKFQDCPTCSAKVGEEHAEWCAVYRAQCAIDATFKEDPHG